MINKENFEALQQIVDEARHQSEMVNGEGMEQVNMTQTILDTIKDEAFGNEIAIRWHIEDIVERAKDRGIVVLEKDARTILQRLDHNHDCYYGITWEMIDCATDCLLDDTNR